MRRLEANDIKDLNLLKHYRVIRRWACRNNGLSNADLELIIYLDCVGLFNRLDFIKGVYSYSWDNRRWARLKKEGWITVFAKRNRTTTKSSVYKVSIRGKHLISRIYRIMLGEEDIPTTKISKGKAYTDKVLTQSIKYINKDKLT
jgi:hypothetical protein